MTVRSIDIRYYNTGDLCRSLEGLHHVKTLPCLSVVQSLEGWYDVRLGDGPLLKTVGKGAFIAPSAVIQNLTHHDSPESGVISARWVFLDVIVNGTHRLDSLYSFPPLMPKHCLDETEDILSQLLLRKSLCADLSQIYRMIDLLLRIGVWKEHRDRLAEEIVAYVCEHYTEKIDYAAFAAKLNVSESTLFRKFRAEFGKTPAHYINEFRVLRAAELLATEEIRIRELSHRVGFEDEFYFSRRFKSILGVSPSSYREKYAENPQKSAPQPR